jgi:EmrB/QacA subfamily drug resistance transporter
MATVVNTPCDLGVIRSGPAPAASSHAGLWVLAATILGSSMVYIDGTAVNVALPAIQTAFRTSAAQVQWVVEAYSLFLAALILLGGALGDRLGRRRIFTSGVILFTGGSILCGLAPSSDLLIAARSIQGIGGALLAPTSLAIISASFNQDDRGKAIGIWSGFSAITSAAGPLLGGLLVEQVSWRAVFFINAPLALAVLALVRLHVDESYGETRTGGIDWLGASLATAGLGALTYGLLSGSAGSPTSPVAVAGMAAGIVALAAFVAVEARVPTPMMPLGLFRSRVFSGANVLTLLLYGALGAVFYFLPFDLIQVQGYSPFQAGLTLLPAVLIIFLLSRWSGGLSTRVGVRLPLIAGPAVAAAGFALLALPGVGGGFWTSFAPGVIVLGLGMAVAVAPLTTAVLNAAGEEHAGVASGVNNAVSRSAGLIAVAVLGLVLAGVFRSTLDARLTAVQLAPAARQSIVAQEDRLAGITLPPDLPAATAAPARRAINESFVAGFRVVMIAAAVLALVSALSTVLMISDPPRSKA